MRRGRRRPREGKFASLIYIHVVNASDESNSIRARIERNKTTDFGVPSLPALRIVFMLGMPS